MGLFDYIRAQQTLAEQNRFLDRDDSQYDSRVN